MSITFAELHKLCMQNKDMSFAERLQSLCEIFLNTPYGPWHDGSSLESLDDFHPDLNQLDCVTFVEVVLALIKTKPIIDIHQFIDDFMSTLRHIHYANGKPDFISRNHFICVDWIVNNKFMVEDITKNLFATTVDAVAQIDKLNWMRKHNIMQHGLLAITPQQEQKFAVQESRIPYIPTIELLKQFKECEDKMPEYSIVNIVRPDWNLKEKIGTNLNTSHLGFAIKNSAQQLSFYHATSVAKKVVKLPLLDYVTQLQDSPTIGGVNVLVISPGYYSVHSTS